MAAGTASGTVVTCPGCAKRFKVRPESVGRRVRCPQCKAPVDTGAVLDAQEAKVAAARKTLKEGGSLRPGRHQASFMRGSPDSVRAMVLGIIGGAVFGLMTGILFGILIAVVGLATGGLTEIISDSLGAAAILVIVAAMVVLNVLYYAIFGGACGLVLGLTQNIWAGYGVAALFILASFFIGGLFTGVIAAVLFTGFVINVINANMAR